MKTRLLRELRRLASKQYQVQNIISGTPSTYVLPEEILETTETTLRTILCSALLSRSFSELELEAAHRCLETLSSTKIAFGDKRLSNEKLILHDVAWESVRQAAETLLAVLDVDKSEIT